MSAVEAPAGLVASDRRVGERRASMHLCVPDERRGKFVEAKLTTHQRSRTETMMVEAQAAQEYAEEAVAHAATALQKLHDDLRAALAAVAAAKRAAHIAAGIVSGVEA